MAGNGVSNGLVIVYVNGTAITLGQLPFSFYANNYQPISYSWVTPITTGSATFTFKNVTNCLGVYTSPSGSYNAPPIGLCKNIAAYTETRNSISNSVSNSLAITFNTTQDQAMEAKGVSTVGVITYYTPAQSNVPITADLYVSQLPFTVETLSGKPVYYSFDGTLSVNGGSFNYVYTEGNCGVSGASNTFTPSLSCNVSAEYEYITSSPASSTTSSTTSVPTTSSTTTVTTLSCNLCYTSPPKNGACQSSCSTAASCNGGSGVECVPFSAVQSSFMHASMSINSALSMAVGHTVSCAPFDISCIVSAAAKKAAP